MLNLRDVGRLLPLLALALVLPLPRPAAAFCVVPPTSELKEISYAAETSPTAELPLLERQISSSARGDASRLAWLYAIQAEAHDLLAENAQAVAAVERGLEIAPSASKSVRAELLVLKADLADTPDVKSSMSEILQAKMQATAGSPDDVCLKTMLGLLQYKASLYAPSVLSLMQAYRVSSVPALARQHAVAATYLAVDLGSFRDPQAVEVQKEVLAWDEAHKLTFSVASDHHYLGALLGFVGKHDEAIEELRKSIALSAPYRSARINAYNDLELCENFVQLKRFEQASRTCSAAARAFRSFKDPSEAQADTDLAAISLSRHEAGLALSILNKIMASGATNSVWLTNSTFYHLRSQAYEATGHNKDALSDLERYVELYGKKNDSERARQTTVLRAELETDRQIARAQALQGKLALAAEHHKLQLQQASEVAIAAGSASLLLGLMVFSVARDRRRLRKVASTDALTGLLNRGATIEEANGLLRRLGETNAGTAIAIMDLDHFKSVNDTHGHAAGDEVLRRFAGVARTVLRKRDVIGRWGGEEFLLILPDTPLDRAEDVVQRVRDAVGAVELSAYPGLQIRFSAGLARSQTSAVDLDAIVASADQALYEAKRLGRNRTVVDPTPSSPVSSESFVEPKAPREAKQNGAIPWTAHEGLHAVS